jgi:hypothetical protein
MASNSNNYSWNAEDCTSRGSSLQNLKSIMDESVKMPPGKTVSCQERLIKEKEVTVGQQKIGNQSSLRGVEGGANSLKRSLIAFKFLSTE